LAVEKGLNGQSIDIWSLGCIFSEAATWIAAGYLGVVNYRKRRQFEIDQISRVLPEKGFHDGKTLLKAVQEHHQVLPQLLQIDDSMTREILQVMIEEMLDVAALRPTAAQLWRKSERILKKIGKKRGAPIPTNLEAVGKISSQPYFPQRQIIPTLSQKSSRESSGSLLTTPRESLTAQTLQRQTTQIYKPQSVASIESQKESPRDISNETFSIFGNHPGTEILSSNRHSHPSSEISAPATPNEIANSESNVRTSDEPVISGKLRTDSGSTTQDSTSSADSTLKRTISPLFFSIPGLEAAQSQESVIYNPQTMRTDGSANLSINNISQRVQSPPLSPRLLSSSQPAASKGSLMPVLTVGEAVQWRAKKKKGQRNSSLPSASLLRQLSGRDHVCAGCFS
jgi:hypothetical protein